MRAHPLSGGELAAFVAAVEAGSMHEAADALDLTQSAVTKRVQALERRVGTALVERGRFGVRPTVAGRALYPEAKQALAALARAEAVVADHGDAARRRLALAASHTVGEYLVPDWVAGFRAEHPGLRAEVAIINSPGVLRAVREGEAEVGFVEGLDPLDGLEAMTVARDELVAVVAPEHRWARRSSVRAAELAEEPYYTREAGSGTRAIAAGALAAAGIELEPALETASSNSVKRALGEQGFTLLSRLVVQADSLTALTVEGADLRRELVAVRLGEAPSRGLAGAFWRWLGAWRA